ncbi:MAG: xanthine phosphoribosyltransferase [Bacteroidaceae bacterium]|nr:xanthine phosphoribosyltransferase [Bacteroidaceae bacterium]
MKELQEKIEKDGKIMPGGIIRVDSFLNHQIDPILMQKIGKEISRLFKDDKIDKILTLEASGIAPALMAGLEMGVPVVYAKKKIPNTMESAFTAQVHSFTKGNTYTMNIKKEALKKGERILFVDDFLAYGNAALGIIDICKQAGAKLVGMAFCVEKEFQQGRVRLLAVTQNVKIESLAIVQANEITDSDRQFMQQAIDLSVENVRQGGGPFGAVIVRDGKVISTGVNRVTINHDPTAHAEVQAIRNACQNIKNFKLDGCTIYTSCEPCPMCLSAIYWSGISKIYFGNTKQDAKVIDFDDQFIYDEIEKTTDNRRIPSIAMMRGEAQRAFEEWTNKTDKVEY